MRKQNGKIFSIFLSLVFLFLNQCGDFFNDNYLNDEDDQISSDEVDGNNDYELDVSGSLGNDFNTVTITGNLTKNSASIVGSKLKIEQINTGLVKTVKTNSKGTFTADFDLDSSGDVDAYEVSFFDSVGTVIGTTSLEVDLSGEWDGDLSITSKSEACDRVPIISSLDTPVTVEQLGNEFVVYLGGYLDLYPIHVNVAEDLAVSGEGSLYIPSMLAGYVGCYSNVTFSFEGKIDDSANPFTFDVDFNASLSGEADDCNDPPTADCKIKGSLTGEQL